MDTKTPGIPEGQGCDFCAAPAVTSFYCDNAGSEFELPNGLYFACGECAELIGAEDREGLRSRAVMVWFERWSATDPDTTFAESLHAVAEFQGAFWEGRTAHSAGSGLRGS